MTYDAYKTAWHTPAHLFRANAVYMLTGASYQKRPMIHGERRKQQWREAFQTAADLYHWAVLAWVVLDNHYHVIVQAPETSAESLPSFVSSYHKFTARKWNGADAQKGRRVWWNYWDTCLRSEADYLARWNYVHWNPVKHGLVAEASDYAFSSYRDYFQASPDEVHRIEAGYAYTTVEDVPDDF